jgi:DNA-binding MarR family transcriptional regulator
MLVRHTCDNSSCVNPKHLLLGSQKDNMADCVARRRTATGERQHLAVMTETSVRELRALASAVTQMDLAAKYQISQATVSQIVRGVTWRHLL